MRADLEAERAQLEGKSFDAELQQTAAAIEASAAALRAAVQKVAELRRERDRLGAATQAATRYRVAQESAADLQAQVQPSCHAVLAAALLGPRGGQSCHILRCPSAARQRTVDTDDRCAVSSACVLMLHAATI